MSKHSTPSSRIIEDLRNNMQPLSDKCHRDIIEDEKVADTKVCALVNGETCKVYAYPEAKWRLGDCVMATHIETEAEKIQSAKKRVGQQKQKKKSRR